jgi:D-3-phosphoglycerate dehydrogenase
MKILFSAPYMIPFRDRFMPVFQHFELELLEPEVHERLSENELLGLAGQFDGAICGDDRFTERVLLACAPRLKVISKWGTGIDSIDKPKALQMGIQVRNTLNAFTLPVADSVMGYMLAFARRQPWMDQAVKSGRWQKIPGRSLSECVLGVVGVGNIGKAVLKRAKAFGMQLLGNDIVTIEPDFLLENKVEMTNLQDLMQRSDFISLNCDLNPTSFHLMNSKTFAFAKPGAVVINTARGPLIEESALIDALMEGKIGGAALDVFEDEPLPVSSPLCRMENVMLAPHNANSSPAAWERVHWNTLRNLIDGLGLPSEDLNLFIDKN